jgi:hypothetical protein
MGGVWGGSGWGGRWGDGSKGAAVAFTTAEELMQLSFWETGEADFFGIELPTCVDIIGFNGRLIDDSCFEETFRECFSAVVSGGNTTRRRKV